VSCNREPVQGAAHVEASKLLLTHVVLRDALVLNPKAAVSARHLAKTYRSPSQGKVASFALSSEL
jgi:hypothetical protein